MSWKSSVTMFTSNYNMLLKTRKVQKSNNEGNMQNMH